MNKSFNSKNLVKIIINLLSKERFDVVLKLLNSKELKSLRENIFYKLYKLNLKEINYNQIKVYSKYEVDQNLLQNILNENNLNSNNKKIIIDDNLLGGLIIKFKDLIIDGSLETMFKQAINKKIQVKK